MPQVTVGQENGHNIDINFNDNGLGEPVVLIAGYPLDGRAWEKQELMLLEAGYRVITYDRRGFGGSSQTTIGYDYDTLAADLKVLLEDLDLNDVVLVGHSMGTGEIVRYLGRYGSARVSKAVLLESLVPFLAKTDDNPEGVDTAVFTETKAAIIADRPAYFKAFLDNFNNMDVLFGTRISDEAWQASFIAAVGASAFAALACVDSWLEDFRGDVAKIDVPILLMHGDADRILPIEATAARLPALIKDLTYVVVKGGPHNIPWTFADVVNPALLDFLKK